MKVHPLTEEIIDLRHKLHVMNAEKFLETQKQHIAIVNKIDTLIKEGKMLVSVTQQEKFQALCGKGQYYSIRGHHNQSFVRYTMNLKEVNASLRLLHNELISIAN